LLCALALCLPVPASFAVSYTFSWDSGFANGGVVPDGNVTGWNDMRTLTGIAENAILDVNVTLRLTGGWNGDLYAYLTHDSGFTVLLNRAGRTGDDGFGYGDAGLDVIFDDGAANGDFHAYQAVPGYATSIADGSLWAPDGRNVSPLTVLDSDLPSAFLSGFNGLDPNGNWTLFVADVGSGEVSTVARWGLTIEAEYRAVGVPDAGGTLALLGAACGAVEWFKRRLVRRSLRP